MFSLLLLLGGNKNFIENSLIYNSLPPATRLSLSVSCTSMHSFTQFSHLCLMENRKFSNNYIMLFFAKFSILFALNNFVYQFDSERGGNFTSYFNFIFTIIFFGDTGTTLIYTLHFLRLLHFYYSIFAAIIMQFDCQTLA